MNENLQRRLSVIREHYPLGVALIVRHITELETHITELNRKLVIAQTQANERRNAPHIIMALTKEIKLLTSNPIVIK